LLGIACLSRSFSQLVYFLQYLLLLRQQARKRD
jgi:hypothetical protein